MPALTNRVALVLARHVRLVVLAAVVVTAVLAVPFVAMQPTSTASPEPDGPVFQARDTIEERFDLQVFTSFFILEARDGNVLAPEVLREVHAGVEALRADPDLSPLLLERFDPDLGVRVVGTFTLADAVATTLEGEGLTLQTAPDDVVAQVADRVIDQQGPVALGLSEDARPDPTTGTWTAEAMTVQVLADNQALGGGANSIAIGADSTEKEAFARDVQAVLRGQEETYQAWGVAIDANLTAGEEGQAAGPFIGLTLVGVLAIVGLTYRSYWAVAVTGAGLAMMIVWLRGISNLVGLENDQVLDTIVPIALISFGIDFAFHALGRYREEEAAGRPPRGAVAVGLAGIMGALVLALSSDTAAFLSNTASGIESTIQFGVAASIGLLSAFLLLGIATPLVVAHLEALTGRAPASRGGRVLAVAGATGAAFTVMGTVLLGVYVLPPAGIGLLAVYLLGFLLVPWLVARRQGQPERPVVAVGDQSTSRLSEGLGAMSAALAGRGGIVLPLAAVLTAVMGFYAVQIPTEFDVQDFFSADTDFVVGLDKLDEHVGEQGGEPGQVLVSGDLADLASLEALATFEADLQALDSDRFGVDDDGRVALDAGVLDVVRTATSSPAAQAAVAAETGVELTDTDGDGLPDRDEQVAAVLQTAARVGVPFDQQRLAYTAGDVGEVFDAGDPDVTVLTLSLPGSRAVENVEAAAAELDPLLAELSARLQATSDDADAVLTGSPFVRQGGLDAITRALLVSLPIAIVLCFTLGAAFMRSVRYGLVAIVPILLVVTWLYGVMERTGFAINLVTGTIGAISIGIGIDFAIHYLMRYREELATRGNRLAALRATGEGTGVALVASAGSSIVGFAMLALAPMPLFASYGLLTAVMIAMALVASLVVLPPLLYVVTRDAEGSVAVVSEVSDPATVAARG